MKDLQEFTPATQTELRRFVEENARGRRRPLYPAGGRTSLNYGGPAPSAGVLVSTSKLTKVIDYPARDMTITVEAGIRMDDLAATLKDEGQQLPIDAPQETRATLGGVIAAGVSGPRRYGYGTLRDYLIGVTAIDADGRLFKAGGRVVKNVAGYDLCKLLIGSLGTLAILTQATLKLRPLPGDTAFVWASFRNFQRIDSLLEALLTSEARPVVLDVLNPVGGKQIAADSRQRFPTDGPLLAVGVEGTPRETAWQVQALQKELAGHRPADQGVFESKDALKFRSSLAEFQSAADEPLTFRANLLPSRTMEFMEQASESGIALQSHAGNGIVIGTLPDTARTAADAVRLLDPLRELACAHRGNLVILHCEDDWKRQIPVFGAPEPTARLMSRLKQKFDPRNLLNPGRIPFTPQPA